MSVQVGYGDVLPTTEAERLFATAVFVLGGALWAYVVGAVCAIVASLDEAANECVGCGCVHFFC